MGRQNYNSEFIGPRRSIGRAIKDAPGYVGKQVMAAGGAMKRHPYKTAGIGAGAVAAGIGAEMLRRKLKAKNEQKGYAIDEETGVVSYNGVPIGEVAVYDADGAGEANHEGMKVEGTCDPEELPDTGAGPGGDDPDLKITDAAVGEGAYDGEGVSDDPWDRTTNFTEEVDSEDSDQFASTETAETYQLRQELDEMRAEHYDLIRATEQLTKANALLQASKQAEQYKQILTAMQKQGTPVTDVEGTVDYLMSQSEEQVEKYFELLQKTPKINNLFNRMPMPSMESAQDYAMQDFEANKEAYNALGIKSEDLKYAKYLGGTGDTEDVMHG